MEREKITEHVSQMLSSEGIKSVRMDDIANSLRISKRTLYELFGDKDQLLYESLMFRDEQLHRAILRKTAGCSNTLEAMLTAMRELNGGRNGWADSEKRLMSNLRKFYPHIFERVQRDHAAHALEQLQGALNKCRDEGYLDPHADIGQLTQLFFLTMGSLMCDSETVLPRGITLEEARSCMLINFLRGLSSTKGMEVIDEILAREEGRTNDDR